MTTNKNECINALQTFIKSKPCGFLKSTDMPALITLDRLFPVLVRCGSARFTCAAQDCDRLIKCIEAGDDYVRDVSFPVGSMELAADWQPSPQTYMESPQYSRDAETPGSSGAAGALPDETTVLTHFRKIVAPFDESQCGGVFDGHGVTSDADPGL